MSENGGEIPNPEDHNLSEIQVGPEGEKVVYKLLFGDLVTFGDKDDKDAERSVVVDVGTGENFQVGHLERTEDDQFMLSPVGFSTHGVERAFNRYDETWSVGKIKEAMENYFQMELIKAQPRDDDSEQIKTIKERIKGYTEKRRVDNFRRLDDWAKNQSRDVTVNDINKGKEFK